MRRHRGQSGYHDEAFHDDKHVTRTLAKLLDDASSGHRKLDPARACRTPSSTTTSGSTSSTATSPTAGT